MDPFELDLRTRLARLEGAVPVTGTFRRPRWWLARPVRTSAAVVAASVLLAFAAGLAAGQFVNPQGPIGHEGLENPGQPFHGTGITCMTPADANALIVARGFSVTWQIEDRDPSGSGSTTLSDVPPPRGIVDGGFVEGRHVHVVVSVGSGSLPHGNCP